MKWLEEGRTYRGLALLSVWEPPKVRLFHPDGDGWVELRRDEVEEC